MEGSVTDGATTVGALVEPPRTTASLELRGVSQSFSTKTGELLGIMVNSDYCALVTQFRAVRTLTAGDDVQAQHTAELLNALDARVRALPLKLQ